MIARLHTPEEAAQHFSVTPTMIAYLCKEKLIPYHQIGRDRRVRIEELQPYANLIKNATYKRSPGYRRTKETNAMVERLRLLQKGKCAICGSTTKKLCVDHDHKSGAIRGLLCQGCNFGLGVFRDSAQHLRAAANYVTQRATNGGRTSHVKRLRKAIADSSPAVAA